MKTHVIIAVSGMLACRVALGTTYYVNAARPNDAGDGLSWAKAKKSIQAAVDLTVAGDVVIVTNGQYMQGGAVTPGHATWNRVVITNDIVVRSMHGPGVTIIRGRGPTDTNTVRCVYMSGGLLSGFTLQGGYLSDDGDWHYDRSGGGVNMYGGNGVVSNCAIVGNFTVTYGGGVYSGTVMNCLITDNEATEGAGTWGSVVKGCTISGNFAHGGGGGTAYGTVRDSVISDNDGGDMGSGGGVYGSTVSNCTICDNRVNTEEWGGACGGGVSEGVVMNCVISNNTAYRGGGVDESVVMNSLIIGNRANNSAGGACTSVLHNCLLVANTAGASAGGAWRSELRNCTIVANSSTNGGGGTDACVMWNCIVWSNRARDNNGGSLNYCCTPQVAPGMGNITNDPQFISAGMGNYRLRETSPCINAGTNMPEMAWQTDLDGNPRVYDGRVDMGCYEYVPEPGGLGAVGLVLVTIYGLRFTIWGRRREVK